MAIEYRMSREEFRRLVKHFKGCDFGEELPGVLVKMGLRQLPVPYHWQYLTPRRMAKYYHNYLMKLINFNLRADLKRLVHCSCCGWLHLPEWNHLRSVNAASRSKRCKACSSAGVAHWRTRQYLGEKEKPTKSPIARGHVHWELEGWAKEALEAPSGPLRDTVDASLLNERVFRKSSRAGRAPEEP